MRPDDFDGSDRAPLIARTLEQRLAAHQFAHDELMAMAEQAREGRHLALAAFDVAADPWESDRLFALADAFWEYRIALQGAAIAELQAAAGLLRFLVVDGSAGASP